MWPPDLIIILKATKKTNGKYFKLQPLKILFRPGAPWQLSQKRVTLQNCSDGLWESLWWFLGARTKSMVRLPGYKLFERPLALAYLILIQIYWNETLTPKYSPPISSGKIWSKVETAQGEDQGTRSLMLATQCSSCTEESSVTPRRLTSPQTTTFTSWGWDPVSTPFQHNLLYLSLLSLGRVKIPTLKKSGEHNFKLDFQSWISIFDMTQDIPICSADMYNFWRKVAYLIWSFT